MALLSIRYHMMPEVFISFTSLKLGAYRSVSVVFISTIYTILASFAAIVPSKFRPNDTHD